MLKIRSSALALVFTGALVAPTFADTVTFKNGREVHGRLISEDKSEIVMQVGTGQLHFAKKDIATFTEDSDIGQRYFTPPRRADAVDPTGSTASAGKDRPWTRHKDASQDELKDLKGVHARILEELAKLGPSPEARLHKYELSAADRGSLDNAIAGLAHGGGRTSADIVSFALKAIPALCESLQSGDSTTRGAAAVTLADVVTRGDADDARWLIGKGKAGANLAGLLEASGDEAAANARTAANRALEQISGTSYNWIDSKDPYPTESQRGAIKQWKLWASVDASNFESGEKKYAEAAKKLDDAWKSLEDSKGWREALSLAKDAYGTGNASTGTGAPDDAAARPALSGVNGEVAKSATPEEQKKIQDLKGKIKDCLEKIVGPSIEDLKAKYALSSEERQDAQNKIYTADNKGQRRAKGQKENNATADLVAYGPKVIDLLAAGLENESIDSRWGCAKSLGAVSGQQRDDSLRLILYYKAPGKITSLLSESEDTRAPQIRTDADAALQAISGVGQGWMDSPEQSPTEVQTTAAQRWRSWALRAEIDAEKREKAREDHRKKLNDLLKDLDRASKWKEAVEKAPKELDQTEKDLKTS